MLQLPLRQRPQIAERDRVLGDDVRLARRRPLCEHLVDVDSRPAEDKAGVECQVRLAGVWLTDASEANFQVAYAMAQLVARGIGGAANGRAATRSRAHADLA